MLLALAISVVRGDDAFLTEPRKCQVNCDIIATNYQVGWVNVQVKTLVLTIKQ